MAPIFLKHTSQIRAVAVSPDGKYVVTGSSEGTVHIWLLKSIEGITIKVKLLKGHTGWVYAVAVSPDGKYVVTGSGDNTIRVWDLETGEILRVLDRHTSRVYAMAISPDGKYVVTGSNDNTARVWDLETGKTVRVFASRRGIYSLAVLPDSKHVVSKNDYTAHIWNLETGETVRVLEGHTSYVLGIAVSPDGKYVVTGSRDKTARVWNFHTGETVRVLEHTSDVNAVAVFPDGKYVVTGSGDALTGSGDNTARVWNLETGETVRVLEGHTSEVRAVAVSPDGKYVLTVSGDTAYIWKNYRELLKTSVNNRLQPGFNEPERLSNFQNNLMRLCNEVYREIGGYGPEKFYQEALLYELDLLYKNCYNIYKEDSTPLLYKGLEMSSRRLDITIYSKNNNVTPLIILELKWTNVELEPWQLSNYMKIRNCRYGFMINFEKLGSHPTNYCAQIYDVDTDQQLIFPKPEQRRGSVKILRFENLE